MKIGDVMRAKKRRNIKEVSIHAGCRRQCYNVIMLCVFNSMIRRKKLKGRGKFCTLRELRTRSLKLNLPKTRNI